MMRTPSKAVMVSSSPVRADKLPAPILTTLLRGNGGSRSRGRSSSMARSSPMFTARRRGASLDIQEKEPSSPKVTCIGQVRIRKRKSSSSSAAAKPPRRQGKRCAFRGCRCPQGGFFRNPFSKRFIFKFWSSTSSARRGDQGPPRGWRRWFLLPRPGGCCRQTKSPRQRPAQELQGEDRPRMPAVTAAVKVGTNGERARGEGGAVEEGEEEETKIFVPAIPPKNALLLMRCRSAPHRAAGLPDRFYVSAADVADVGGGICPPLTAAGDEEPPHTESRREEQPPHHCPVSTYENHGGVNGGADSREAEEEDGETAAVGPSPSFSSRPLILTRCKSEPAGRAAKLAAPEAAYCFWGSSSSSSNQMSDGRSKNNGRKWLPLLGEEARAVPSQ